MSDGGGDRQDNRRDSTHALYGADLATLWRIWRKAGGLAPGQRLRFAGAFGAAAGRLPFTLAEAAYTAARRSAVADAPPPVFILGHWRSGTTHLYNVLSKSPDVAYVSPFATALPWDFLLLGRMLQPMLAKKLPERRYIDNVTVEPTSPQEDEIALANMTDLSFYHALYFPRRFHDYFNRGVFLDGVSDAERAAWEAKLRLLYDKLMLAQPGRRLVIKNPVYTARVAQLRRMWPDAKFIHIHRTPFKVFPSMRNFYTALFRQFALQDYGGVDIDEVILQTYERMMGNLVADTADLPSDRFVELSFNELQQAPMDSLARIYETLGLEGFDRAAPHFSAYLKSVADYRKNTYGHPQEVVDTVTARWAPFIDRWGYGAEA